MVIMIIFEYIKLNKIFILVFPFPLLPFFFFLMWLLTHLKLYIRLAFVAPIIYELDSAGS